MAKPVLSIDVVSDVICPWCFIGKRRLEEGLKLLGDSAEVKVNWKPFQLNPQMPPQEDAGCTNAEMLNHCRQPGEHVRGCWPVDLVLRKE